MSPMEEIATALEDPLMFQWKVFDLGIEGQRRCRINFTYWPKALADTLMRRELAYDFEIHYSSITRRGIWEMREAALQACLNKAHPERLPKIRGSLWWHLKTWWRNR